MKTLAFTCESISRLSRFGITNDWFEAFELPAGTHGLKRVSVRDCLYIIEDDLNDDDAPLVLIQLSGPNKVFANNRHNAMVLDRIILAASAHNFSTVQIPTNWRAYSEGDVVSFYAGNLHRNKDARLHAKKNPNGSTDLYFFAWSDKTVNFSELHLDMGFYSRAKDAFAEAILQSDAGTTTKTTAGIFLCERLPQGFTQGASLRQWYDSILTSEQRRFVDMPYEGPVRLRGAAGTGKTLSLVVKLLWDGLKRKEIGAHSRFCFISHSQGAVDLVQAISNSLLPPRVLNELSCATCSIEMRTLYDLANDRLQFQLRDLRPVSLDGFDGRKFQFDLIVEILADTRSSRIFRGRFRDISPVIQERWASASIGKDASFVAELMNEFACVLDAEHIRRGEESAERYVTRTRRPNWLLDLPTERDRRFVLEIHTLYRKDLSEMNALSVDQMIADLNLFLDSNSWDRERDEKGFDAIFVDELHLFTSLEKQILPKLTRRQSDGDNRPIRPNIFMAYDLKQSPRDTFVDYFAADGSIFSAKSGLQRSELVQLNRVFRYTPEIAEFLRDIDAAFPAIDVPGEWDAYVGEAELDSADRPKLVRFSNNLDQLEGVFRVARRTARANSGGGRRVAVLCVSEETFGIYQKPARGRFRESTYLVNSREETANLRHLGKRFVFSMPEYVAGLQFETVFLLNVDQSEAVSTDGIGRRRQLVSSTYLGASRAEKDLVICCVDDRGGPSDILDLPIDRHSLIEGDL